MGLIIDTCVFIRHEKSGKNPDTSMFSRDEEVYITAITVSELLVGVHRADTETRRLKRSAFVETIIGKIPALSFTDDVARIHAELYAWLLKQGNMIGAHDLIIAATAVFYDCALLTYNAREFQKIPGLKLANLFVA